MSAKTFTFWKLVSFIIKHCLIVLLISSLIFSIAELFDLKTVYFIIVWFIAILIFFISFFVIIYPKVQEKLPGEIIMMISLLGFFTLFVGWMFGATVREINSDVVKVNNPEEIKKEELHDYYVIENFVVNPGITGIAENLNNSTKSKAIYHASPITSAGSAANVHPYSIWFCQSQHKNIRPIARDKDNVIEAFRKSSYAQYLQTNFYETKVFKRWHNDATYNSYSEAARQSKLAAPGELVILTPFDGGYEKRYQTPLFTFIGLTLLGLLSTILIAYRFEKTNKETNPSKA